MLIFDREIEKTIDKIRGLFLQFIHYRSQTIRKNHSGKKTFS
jgi:hypothetical protein